MLNYIYWVTPVGNEVHSQIVLKNLVPCTPRKPQDVLLAEKSKELGQQVGIIEYINKLSSSNIANGVPSSVPGPAVTVHASKVASVPLDSERGR